MALPDRRHEKGISMIHLDTVPRTVLILLCLIPFIAVEESAAQSRDRNPLEAGNELDEIRRLPDSVIGIGVPQSWFDFKDDVYEKIGLKFGFSYQLLYQSASEVLPDATYDTAAGHWWGFLTKWTPLNRGKDYEGTLVFSMFDRASVGNNQVPAFFGVVDVGGITTNAEFTTWSFQIENLYWEQNLNPGKHKIMLRVGNQVVTTLLNPFRFKDARVSFTTGPFAFHPTIPYPTFGFGVGAKWWPDEESELYFAASLNDMNSDPNVRGFDWSTVSRGEFFYGSEVGYYWKRGADDFDHVHLLVFYADEQSTASPDTPNKAGGGFRIFGSKQWNRWVGFAGYTYNTAEGGGVTGTFSNHTATAGVAYKNPFSIKGEAALGVLYMDPIDELFGEDARSQYGTEVYWRILLSPHIWLTPGLQTVIHPSLNPDADVVWIPHVKFRVAL
jgi:hypothetical protein